MIGELYIIRNDINNKVYIGKTYIGYINRWKRHLQDLTKQNKSNNKFYKAIKEIGINHFKIELIDQFEEGILEQKEIEYIAKYDSYHNGYNSTLGGDGKKSLELSDDIIQSIIDMYNNKKSMIDIQKKLDLSQWKIRNILTNNNITIEDRSAPIEVIMYDKYWSILYRFKSIDKAYRYCINEYGYIDSHAFYREINKAFIKGNICYNHRWQKLNDLIYEDNVFLTIFDKEEYLNGNVDIEIIDGFMAINNCNRPLSGNDICPLCGQNKAIVNSICNKCKKIKYKNNKINNCNPNITFIDTNKNNICINCGKYISILTKSGLCKSCSQVIAKGKINKPSKDELKQLLKQGFGTAQIAEMYERSQSTVSTWKKQYNL